MILMPLYKPAKTAYLKQVRRIALKHIKTSVHPKTNIKKMLNILILKEAHKMKTTRISEMTKSNKSRVLENIEKAKKAINQAYKKASQKHPEITKQEFVKSILNRN